jgi:topoisomerase-4 subunit A
MPPGAVMRGMIVGEEGDTFFVGSDAGYGFICKYEDMVTKNKSGKSIVSVPKGCSVLPPLKVGDPEEHWLALGTNTGHLLIISMAELPELSKGKGIKLIGIPGAKASSREEYVKSAVMLGLDSTLVIHAGKKHKALKGADMDKYLNERGRRGMKMPRGFQGFDRMEVWDE